MSDEAIVRQVTDYDQELYVHIVERYQGPLIRYVRTLVYDEDKAADVVQNTFIKAFTNLRSFNTSKKFSSWIYRIAHNEAINFIKKHAKEVRPDNEEWFDRLPDSQELAVVVVDKQLLHDAMKKLFKELDRKYRQPLILYAYEGKTYEEISDVLRVPKATVGTRINRAKKQLKKLLEKEGVELS